MLFPSVGVYIYVEKHRRKNFFFLIILMGAIRYSCPIPVNERTVLGKF